MNSLSKHRFFICIGTIMLSFASSFTLACGLHGEEGFSPFFRNHPLAQQRFARIPSPQISLVFADRSVVEDGEVNTVELDYNTPVGFKDVQLFVQGSEHIEVLQDSEFQLVEANGSVTVQYKATKPGRHTITFAVKSLRNGRVKDAKHTLYVVAS